MNKLKYWWIFISAATIITSCKTLQQPPPKDSRTMPHTFAGSTDTTSDATISWKAFFNDSYLTELIDTALANNWDLDIALQRIQMSRSNIRLTRGAMLPFLRGNAAAGITKFGDYTMDGAGNMTTPIYDGRIVPKDLQNYTVSLQTSWEVDLWGRLRNKKRAAYHRFLASIEGTNLVVTTLIADVATAYYELLALDNQLDIIEENIALQEKAVEVVRVQKRAAMTTELGVEWFEAQLLGLKSMRYETRQQITETESRINLLLGRYPQAIPRDKTRLTKALPPRVRTGIPSALLKNRPDIRHAEAELRATRADVKAAKAAFYPSLTITGGIGYEAFLTSVLFQTPQSLMYNVLGGLSAPLLNRSALTSELQRADASRHEAYYNYQKVVTTGFTEIYNQMSRISNLRQVYELKQQQAAKLTNSINISIELFNQGRSNYLEVLVTQQNAIKARLEVVDARKEIYRSTVNIYKALGGGWR